MVKLILKNHYAPGDVVMLTAAVRDLHRCHPGRFRTDVRTPYPELWEHNPWITPLSEHEPGVKALSCTYPLLDCCHAAACHGLHGFRDFLNRRLGLRIQLSRFQGDIHLSAQEKAWYSQVHELTGTDTPFWIVVSGGKYDVPVKWWDPRRYQEVVHHFRGRILFVQVGASGHHHPRLDGVIDLRGQTDLRQLVRLVYHAQGVLGPVTLLMHLAAAVEVKPGNPEPRPCVVVAGGREPAHWEAYPGHQFIHTNGALPCALPGGCWRDRVLPLGDGDPRDRPENRCLEVVRGLPRCLDLITAADVVRRLELYVEGGAARCLTRRQLGPARRGIRASRVNSYDNEPLTLSNARVAFERFIESLPSSWPAWQGRGVVICGGGRRYFPGAWVCIRMLRRLGCSLPIQLWHLGSAELDAFMAALVAPWGVNCVDATRVRRRHPVRRLGGWELKPYALFHAPFREVLLLDADNVPVVNPERLFDSGPFLETGAVFWPDYGQRRETQVIWTSCGLDRPAEPEFDSGQILVDKARCGRALRLSLWFNEHSDFYYQHLHGDKETFHLAFRKLQQPYRLVPVPVRRLIGTMCQHDFDGRRLFQHRNTAKWNLTGRNRRVPDFWFEDECRQVLRQLRSVWDGRIGRRRSGRSARIPGRTFPEPAHREVQNFVTPVTEFRTERSSARERLRREQAASHGKRRP